MRISCRVAVILVIFSGHAWAKPKKANPKHPGTTMDSNDPVDKEKSDEGPFTPSGKTGPLKREEVKQEEAERAAALPPIKRRPRDPVAVFGNLLIGFGKAPEPGPGAEVTSGKTTAATFMVGGHYDLSPDFTVGARLPFTFGSARQTDGLYASSAALGALELMGEDRVGLSRFTQLPIDFGLGVPIAQGNYEPVTGGRQLELNDVADAASGYRDPELFGPKRLPIIVGVGIDYQKLALDVHAATKFVAGVKVGGQLSNDQTMLIRLLDNASKPAIISECPRHSRPVSPSSSEFSRTTRPAKPTWKPSAGLTASFARPAELSVSPIASLLGRPSCCVAAPARRTLL